MVQEAGDEGQRCDVGLEHRDLWQLVPPHLALLRALRSWSGQEDDRGRL